MGALLWALTAAAQASGAPEHRFGLFVGNDSGGEGTRGLLYARDDARRLREVFTRLGGIAPRDAVLIEDGTSDAVLAALSDLERRAEGARARGERTTLFFAYSGHSRDGALRLGATRLPLDTLKDRLTRAPADVRVAILDACRAGSMNRTKGVRRAPAFEVEADATRQAKGLIILTSSAADEDSQESDAIGASYFSYYLTAGLLGAADGSGDGRVSLGEAYQWAYEHTVASTADSAAGAQHPTFSFDLAGNGEVVLTEVAARREGLRIPAGAPRGPWFVVDARGVVVAEVVMADLERRIGLPPGDYVVKVRQADHLLLAEARISPGVVTTVDAGRLKRARFSDDPVKGTGLSTLYLQHWSVAAAAGVEAMFDAPTSRGGVFPSSPLVGVEATLHHFFGRGWGLGVDLGVGSTQGQVNSALLSGLTYEYSLMTVGASVVREWRPETSLVPFAGVRVGLQLMHRSFPGTTLPEQGYANTSPGLVAGLAARLTRSVSLVGRVRVHYLLYAVDEKRSLGYADVGLLLDYEMRD